MPLLNLIHVEDLLTDSELIPEMLRSEGWDCAVHRVEALGVV